MNSSHTIDVLIHLIFCTYEAGFVTVVLRLLSSSASLFVFLNFLFSVSQSINWKLLLSLLLFLLTKFTNASTLNKNPLLFQRPSQFIFLYKLCLVNSLLLWFFSIPLHFISYPSSRHKPLSTIPTSQTPLHAVCLSF